MSAHKNLYQPALITTNWPIYDDRWAGVCWDANLRRADDAWQHYAFKCTKWQQVRNETNQLYLLNAYRVLLTRARQGLIVFVPHGDAKDPTRPPAFYDETYAFLVSYGIPKI